MHKYVQFRSLETWYKSELSLNSLTKLTIWYYSNPVQTFCQTLGCVKWNYDRGEMQIEKLYVQDNYCYYTQTDTTYRNIENKRYTHLHNQKHNAQYQYGYYGGVTRYVTNTY